MRVTSGIGQFLDCYKCNFLFSVVKDIFSCFGKIISKTIGIAECRGTWRIGKYLIIDRHTRKKALGEEKNAVPRVGN